jgi:hypothetical protein
MRVTIGRMRLPAVVERGLSTQELRVFRVHHSLRGRVACEVFQEAKPALKVYTLRR